MRLSLTLIASSAILAACGGGGGGGDGPANVDTSPSAAPATLTTDNYVTVARKALSSNAYLLDSASLVLGAEASDPQVLMRFGQDQMAKLPDWFAKIPAQAVGAVQTQTENCTDGGTLTVSVNDRNGNQELDAGDSVTLSANNCTYAGMQLNGKLSLSVNGINGDPNGYPFSMNATLQYGNLSAKSSQMVTVGNGTITLSLDVTAYNAQIIALSVPNFTTTSTYGGSTTTDSLKDYEALLKISPAGSLEQWASSTNGILASSAFDSKSVRIETTAPFVRSSAQAYPANGSAVITGAANAKVRVTAVDANTVRIELDADADGTFESTTTRRWSEVL